MNERWMQLKIGDFIKIVKIPSYYNEYPYTYDENISIIDKYKYLIENDICLLVGNIDEYGNPWVEFEINELENGVVYYSMGVGQYAMAVNAVNDDSWEYVIE